MTTLQANLSEKGSGLGLRPRQRKIQFVLFLASFASSTVAFVAFDYFYSAAIRRAPASISCGVHDPVREHALKPNCASIEHWGGDSYQFFTNDLGFRDEKIRAVPLTDVRPRILMLGGSFTEGQLAWHESYVGRVADRFPQYDFLNGGVVGYSPSNDLNVARMVLAKGVEVDEVIVFMDIADVQYEAAYFQDADASGAVTGPEEGRWIAPDDANWHFRISRNFALTSDVLESVERFVVGHGYYHLSGNWFGDVFGMEKSAWTYRKVNERDPYMIGYAPLGVEGGIAKEKAKMTLLWQELAKRSIPISVVVYPYPAQLLHDTADSRQVRLWREWCEGKCKRFISLFPAFLAAKDQCPRIQPGCWYVDLFVFGDTHYSAAGNALVADAVIKSLEEEPPAKHQQAVQALGSTGRLQ